jgi:alkylation response protein AidB-like acyl-CoA dehydrogenase
MAHATTSEFRAPAKRPSLVHAAKEMHRLFAAQAALTKRTGSSPIKPLKRCGKVVFGMWMPTAFGSVEASPLEALEAIEQLSYSDGSTGWVLMATQVAMGSAAAYLPAGIAKELFGKGPWPVIAGEGAPKGTGRVDGAQAFG